MFPWIRCGKVKGKYHRYEVHHLHLGAYDRQGCERYLLDVIVLCPFAHWIIHRLLGGAKQIRYQKSKFPNAAQRMAHAWCRLPAVGKLVLVGTIVLLVWRLTV